MKKILILLFAIFLLCSCNKNDEAKNIDDLISYDVQDYFEKGEDNDYIKTYYSNKDSSYFEVKIFSYKNKEVINKTDDYSLDENDYIGSLTDLVQMEISKETFSIGYRGNEESDSKSLVSYVRHKNYVFEFYMNNSESTLTDEQYNDFLVMIQSVKFKY